MLEPGRVLGRRYEIISEIGSGGMANVYKARDNKLGRLVAIKVLKQELALDETILQKFRKEALAAGSLNHPNIVAVYDMGHEIGSDYIVMELIEGITLKEYIRRRDNMSGEEVLKISIRIADALRAAHMNGIIHRDIKPQNIMVTPQGDVKVTDFGIAKAVSSQTVTASGETLGSVHYLSPEQARGAEVDTRSDLYSLGITMYEMITKTLPFNAETPVAVAMMQIHDPFPNPMTKAPYLWPGLCDIIMKLTQKRPEMRYQTAEALVFDMKRLYRNHDFRIHTGAAARVAVMDQVDPETQRLAMEEKKRQEAEKERRQQEREERLKEKKRRRNMVIALSAAAVVMVIALAVILAILLRNGGDKNNESDPDNTGVLSGFEESSDDESEESEESSEESRIVEADNYVGKAYEDAQDKIRDAGLYCKVEPVFDEETEVGYVVKQSPEAGELVGDDMTITLYVSNGPEDNPVLVPNLKNKTVEEAQKILEDLGLRIGLISVGFSDDIGEDHIMEQGIEADTEVASGFKIPITVSLGKDPSKDETTKAGKVTIDNLFTAPGESGNLTVVAVDKDGKETTLFSSSVSYATFTSLGGSMKLDYEAGTQSVKIYLDESLISTRTIQ